MSVKHNKSQSCDYMRTKHYNKVDCKQSLSSPRASSVTHVQFLICIILLSLCMRDLRKIVQLLTV